MATEVVWKTFNVETDTYHDATIDISVLINRNAHDDLPEEIIFKLSRENAKWLRDALGAAIKLNKLSL